MNRRVIQSVEQVQPSRCLRHSRRASGRHCTSKHARHPLPSSGLQPLRRHVDDRARLQAGSLLENRAIREYSPL